MTTLGDLQRMAQATNDPTKLRDLLEVAVRAATHAEAAAAFSKRREQTLQAQVARQATIITGLEQALKK